MEVLVQEISDASPDKEVKQMCSLVKYILQTPEFTVPASISQEDFNTFLNESVHYEQTKDTPESRVISRLEFYIFFENCKFLLPELAAKYSVNFQRMVLTKGITEMASTVGDKFVDYRFSHFIQWLRIFQQFKDNFSEADFNFLLQQPVLFTKLFTYQKSYKEITERYTNNIYSKNVIRPYVDDKLPLIQLILNLYKKDKNLGKLDAVDKIAKNLKILLEESSVSNTDYIKFVLSKFLEMEDVDAILAKIVPSKKFKNLLFNECDVSEVLSISCPGNAAKIIKVCPESKNDVQGAYLEALCKSSGGRRRKSRKRKARRSKRTYRKRRN